MPKLKRKIRMCKELAAAKKKKKDKEDSTVEIFEKCRGKWRKPYHSWNLWNVEENTNVEEESAGDEIEESHISLEDTEDAGNKHG